jgi:hypothetical protein
VLAGVENFCTKRIIPVLWQERSNSNTDYASQHIVSCRQEANKTTAESNV